MYTKTKEEAVIWVNCLQFLSDYKAKELETATSSRSFSYFHSLSNTMSIIEGGNSGGSTVKEGAKPGRKGSGKGTGSSSHKFANIDARAFQSVVGESKYAT